VTAVYRLRRRRKSFLVLLLELCEFSIEIGLGERSGEVNASAKRVRVE
jgi:hypothetical protein